MSNPSGKKGAAFERLIADCLATHVDDRIDRRVKTGAKDRGDIANVRMPFALVGPRPQPFALTPLAPRVVVQVKNHIAAKLGPWVNEAEIQRGNDDALVGLVIHKRARVSDPLEQYVTCTVRDLIALLTGERPDR